MINGDGEVVQWNTEQKKATQSHSFGNPARVREILSGTHEFRRLGDHLMLNGAHLQAAKAYHKALTKGADSVLAVEEGKVAAAHLHARMASALLCDDLFLEARPYASEAFLLCERDPYVRYVHAFALLGEGSDGEALDTLDELALEPSLMPWVNVARAEIDPDSVDASVQRGILAEAVSKEPMSGALHARLSVASEATGHLLDAMDHARIAAWLQPSLLRRWRRYGEAAMRAEAFGEAAEAFECAREVSPFDPRLDALTARAYAVGGDIDQAAVSVMRGLRKNNAERDCLTVLAHLKKSDALPVTPSALHLETDADVVEEKELYIYVPQWPQERKA